MTHPSTSWDLRLRIDGQELAAKYMQSVASVKVLQDIGAAGSVALAIAAPKEEIFAWLDDAKVDEIKGTKKTGIDNDNKSNHRQRVQRVN